MKQEDNGGSSVSQSFGLSESVVRLEKPGMDDQKKDASSHEASPSLSISGNEAGSFSVVAVELSVHTMPSSNSINSVCWPKHRMKWKEAKRKKKIWLHSSNQQGKRGI